MSTRIHRRMSMFLDEHRVSQGQHEINMDNLNATLPKMGYFTYDFENNTETFTRYDSKDSEKSQPQPVLPVAAQTINVQEFYKK